MMMQMLAESGIPALTDNIRKADEDNPKGYYEFEPVKKTKQDPSWLQTSAGTVVKMVHLLLLDLPTSGYKYRVVFMRRNIREVVASQNVMLERLGKSTGDLGEQKLIDMFESQITKVDTYIKNNSCFQVLHVNYNDILKNPAPHVRAINEFLGGNLNTRAMLAVVDPTLYRNRR